MKNVYFVFCLSVAVMACFLVNPAQAEETHSDNTLFQTMHIKQMAKRNFTNNGRTEYVYVKDVPKQTKSSIFSGKCFKPSSTGNVLYDKMRRKNNGNLPPCDTLEIGAVHLPENSKVREVNIAVDLNSRDLRRISGSSGRKLSIAPLYGLEDNKQFKKVDITINNKLKK